MKNPLVIRVVSREEKLAEAEVLISQAEAEMASWPQEFNPQCTINAFFALMQAVSIFENAADLSASKFKKKVADCWMRCATTVARLAYNGENEGKTLLGMEALHYRVYARSVRLYGDLIGELRTNNQLKAAWAQILHLHNLALWAMRAGELQEAERIWLQHIELLSRFDVVNDKGFHNPRDWLEPHFHLAFIRQTLGHSDRKVLATIDEGLAGFEPSKCVSPSALEFCHYLTELKSEILSAQFKKKWEREQRRKVLKASEA